MNVYGVHQGPQIVGTVMNDVLAVTTLMSAVRKKTLTGTMTLDTGTSKILSRLRHISGLVVLNLKIEKVVDGV